MGFLKNVLKLQDTVTSDTGLERLQKLIERENSDVVLEQCSSLGLLSSTDGPVFLRLCLLGCQSTKALGLRFQIVKEVLKVLMTDSNLPNNSASGIVSILQQHLDVSLIESHELVKLVSMCVSQLDSGVGHSLYSRWLNLMSKLLILIGEKDFVVSSQNDDQEITGKDFRQRIVRSLCSTRWSGDLAVNLVIMFRDTELTPDEMQVALEKICDCVKKLDSMEVPPLLYQTLLLCKTSSDCLMILMTVISFFNKKFELRNKVESEDMIDSHDIDDSSLCESSSTVVFHISHAIRMGHSVGKDIIKLLCSSSQIPEVIFSPFTLFLALSLGSDKQFQGQIMECLKSATFKAISLGLKRESNAWLKSTCKGPPGIAKAFLDVIELTTKHGGWDLVGKGVFDVAMTFLDTSPPMIGSIDEKLKQLWALGTRILLDVIKNQPDTITFLMKSLSKRLIFSRAAVRFTDAVHSIVRDSGPLLMGKPLLLLEILEQIGGLGVPGARRLLAALMPIIKFARSLRDVTILILRKALFSPQPECRKIGVTGVLLLLKNFRMTGAVPVTQMLSQSQSSLSQAAVDVHRGVTMSNEALCLEILGVLRRCFSQPAGVKLNLYQGLPDVIVRNSALCGAILDMLYRHAVVLGINRPNAICPIDFDDTIYESGFVAQVKEPIGWFLHCCQIVLLSAREIFDTDPDKDEEAPSLDKMIDLFDDLSKKFSEIEDHVLGIEKNADYTKNSINWLKVEQIKNTIEALMDNVVMSGIDTDPSRASLLLQLFRKHAEFSNLTKSSVPAKAVKTKVKADELNKVEKTKVKAQPSKSNSVSTPLPEYAFSIKAISNLLRVLLADKNPGHQSAVNVLRDDGPFQIFSMKMTIEKLSQVEKSLSVSGEDYRNEHIFGHLSAIGKNLACCTIFDEEADPGILTLAAEALATVIETIGAHYRDRLFEFFETITSAESRDCIKVLIGGLMSKTIFVLESSEFESEDKSKGVLRLAILINTCLPHLKKKGNDPDYEKFIDEFLEWSRSLLSKVDFKETIAICVELALQSETRFKSTLSLGKQLSEKLHACMGDVDESSDKSIAADGNDFVKETNADQILAPLASFIETFMDVSELLICRLKSLLSSRQLSKDNVSELEVAVCHNMAEIVTMVGPLSTTAFQQNSSYDIIFRLLGKVYVIMRNLTKYFFTRSKTCKESVRNSKFDSLVGKLGKALTVKVYLLITSEKENHHSTKKTTDSKLLTKKEFKTIPMLIYKLEAFEKDLIRLDSRCKFGLTNNLKPSSSRDFRLQLEISRAQAEENDSVASSEGEDEDGAEEEACPEAESTRINNDSQESGVSSNRSQESVLKAGINLDAPPAKRLKVKIPFKKLV